jgi:hypothetical protein
MSVIPFPLERVLGVVPDDARMAWLWLVLDGHLNPRKKQIILEAARPEVGFLNREEATVLIAALGLARF